MTVFQLGKVTWFKTFVASTRRSILTRSLTRKVLAMDAFKPKGLGPVMVFLPAFPHCPGSGAENAAGFREPSPVVAYSAAPVAFGRRLPVTPVPATGARNTGVSGVPLPVVSVAATVHCIKSFPRQPSQNPPTPASIPVVY